MTIRHAFRWLPPFMVVGLVILSLISIIVYTVPLLVATAAWGCVTFLVVLVVGVADCGRLIDYGE